MPRQRSPPKRPWRWSPPYRERARPRSPHKGSAGGPAPVAVPHHASKERQCRRRSEEMRAAGPAMATTAPQLLSLWLVLWMAAGAEAVLLGMLLRRSALGAMIPKP